LYNLAVIIKIEILEIMKKFLLTAGLGALFLTACKSQGSATQGSHTLTNYDLKGEWVVSSVDYDKKFKLKPFHENVDVQCFVGGTWKLIPNNYSGSYSLNGKGDCPMVRQAIKFEVTKNKEFRFKKLQDNVKAKKITEGYVLQLENQQKDSFTLTQSVPFEGEVIKVYYQFQRVK
jgi:hypothetical protein